MLGDLLDRYASALDAAGSTVRSRLRPGRQPDDVRRTIGELGIEPTDEVVELFVWADGVDEPWNASVFWECNVASLDALCEVWRETREYDSGDRHWPGPAAWFPVLALDSTEYMSVDCSAGADRGAVWFLFAESEGERVFNDLAEAIDAATYCVEAGLWQLGPDGDLRVDRQHMPWAHDRVHPPWCGEHH